MIFSITMGAEYLSYVQSIATFAPTFYGYIISVLASVYSVDSIKRTVHLAFHRLFSLSKILFTKSKQYF